MKAQVIHNFIFEFGSDLLIKVALHERICLH